MASQGQRVGVLELTAGELGTLGDPETRIAETRAAAQVLGLSWRGNLGLPDGGLADLPGAELELAQALRELQPGVLLLPHAEDRHPDHVAAHQLGRRAAHLAGLAKAPLQGAPFRVRRLLCYPGNAPVRAELLVDVGSMAEVWRAAVLCHASQFSGPTVSETVGPEIVERRLARMMYWGTFAGVRYADAFTTLGPLLLRAEALLPLGPQRLRRRCWGR